ncbi:PD-(D/E)XK nuclease family protein, partial [Desulfovibrio sp. OttesenSCG-928-O18]|nr:PD-(D/E)XK nuclease family protein [Desulfovibrio sp. OttesenSCG-928-O18]
MAEPFVNVAWNRPFLPALLDIALERTDGDIGKAFFVFPHARPALYLTSIIREDARVPKPCVMPRMESVSGLFSLVRSQVAARHATPVGILDQVALLLEAVRHLREERGGMLRDLPLDDSNRFFPWGVRLAGLMEEFLTHNRVPEDYIHMQDQASAYAAALLENLGSLHARYLAALEQRGWTTPGLDAFLTARSIAADDCLGSLSALRGKLIILAGFHTLTGAQEVLFRTLWAKHGALVCLHADPKVVHGSPHWSCTPLVRWASAWRTKITPFDAANDTDAEPEIRFRAGYDVHSQLGLLAEELRENAPGESGPTAVVLPDTNLLLPVLHHLPETEVNISMGYPLARSPLFRLLESILALQETRRGTGPFTYHWKALIQLLRHPYLKMLSPETPETEGETAESNRRFRRFLHHAERVVRSSRRFSAVADLGARTAETYREAEKAEPGADVQALFARILEAALFRWENIASPDALAASLEALAELMRERGAALWTRFPIDAECLYRLTESVIPQLAHTALKEEPLPPQTLFTVLRALLAAERVPFEAYPLVGDQVMGVLETRLLHFERVFVMDLTDDRLPGARAHDPLLPEALRPLMGLPGARGREYVAAYNFFRLIHGARRVSLYWQEGVETQGLNDAKKLRSRFVEELLWRKEKQIGRILAPELPENQGRDGPLQLISCVLPPVPREHRTVPAGAHAQNRMRAILAGEISPSLVDSYLRCPARFFYQRIGRINEV